MECDAEGLVGVENAPTKPNKGNSISTPVSSLRCSGPIGTDNDSKNDFACVPLSFFPSELPGLSESPFQVLQFNSDYIVSLSTNVSALVSPQKSQNEVSTPLAAKDEESRVSRLYKTRMSKLHRLRKPYDLPWRHSLERKHLSFDEQCSSSGSNHGNVNRVCGEPCTSGIQRSRSLNEMDFVKWMLEERKNRSNRDKRDLELVSRNMQDLHVL